MTERHPTEGATEVVTRTSPRVQSASPRRYRVLLHNDDFTTMEFVVEVLLRHFGKSLQEATTLMLQVHVEGVAVAGIFAREVAETKVFEVTREAEQRGMPLLVTCEPEEGSSAGDGPDTP